MNNTIKVIVLEPNTEARIEEIEHTLENLQRIVGGYIEAYYPFPEDVCIVCNDEGKINGMELNRAIYSDAGKLLDIIAGPCLICGCSDEDFDSLSDEQCEQYLMRFRYPECFMWTANGIVAIPYSPRKESV